MEPDRLGMWVNEMHADYLAHDRLSEARAHAARQAIVAEVRRLKWLAVRVRLGRLIGAAAAMLARVGDGRAAYEPPVTSMVTPVTKSASLEARKQMTRA
jgi:hypothetical protein